MRDRHHRDGVRAAGVEIAQGAEQIRRGLGEIAAPATDCGSRDRGLARRQIAGPNASSASPGSTSVGIEPHLRRRRVMRRQHPGRERRASPAVAGGRIGQRETEHALDRLARHAAGPQQPRRAEAADDGRIRPRPSTGPPSTIRSMRPSRSAATCAAVVGETWPERLADGATTAPPKARRSACATGCAGTRSATLSSPAVARSHTVQPAAFGSTSVSGPGQNASASASAVASNRAMRARRVEARDMGDQRVERRPALGGVEPRHRRRIGGIGAEPVDGFGRKCDQAAVAQAARGRRRRGVAGRQHPGGQIDRHLRSYRNSPACEGRRSTL